MHIERGFLRWHKRASVINRHSNLRDIGYTEMGMRLSARNVPHEPQTVQPLTYQFKC